MIFKSSSAMPASFIFPLKVQNQSKFSGFIEWYENFHTTTNPETGRKRKGNVKKFLLEELENMFMTGKVSSNFAKVVDEFSKAVVLSPEIQKAKEKLNDADFAKLLELIAKAGV
jgi:hypothetical protein